MKDEFRKLIEWLKRKEPKQIKTRLNGLLDYVNWKQLNYYQSKFLRNLTRSYKKKFGLKKKEILEELEKKIYPELKTALPLVKPKIEPKYAQIIIAEELK